jgi:hypothetical protein
MRCAIVLTKQRNTVPSVLRYVLHLWPGAWLKRRKEALYFLLWRRVGELGKKVVSRTREWLVSTRCLAHFYL